MSHTTWMKDLPERLTELPLGYLAIPGSHNSFSSTLYENQGVAVDEPPWLRFIGAFAKGTIYQWSVTQRTGLLDQLIAGIRYFDLRICKKPDTGKFHFLHGLYGTEVTPSLAKMGSFFKENPSEVIILNMNHFYNMEASDHGCLLEEIVDTLKDFLVPKRELKDLTLANLWGLRRNVIVIYHEKSKAKIKPKDLMDNLIWDGSVITSDWANTDDIEELKKYMEKRYRDKKKPGTDLQSWSGVLTPQTGTILKHLNGSLKDIAIPATEAFCDWLGTKKKGEFKISICVADFVEKLEFVPQVIALNQ